MEKGELPKLKHLALTALNNFKNCFPFYRSPLSPSYSFFNVCTFYKGLEEITNLCLGLPLTDPDTCQYRLVSIIADIALFRLDKPVSPDIKTDSNRQFMHLSFTNKGVDAIHISNILHNKAKK